jgi:hypothetical protein
MRKHVTFFPMRYIPADAGAVSDDADLNTLGLPPNTGVYTVGSAGAGNYVHAITDLRGNELDSATAAFDTDEAGTATAIVEAINARIAAQGSQFGQHAHEAIDGAAGVYYVHYKAELPKAREFLVDLTAPGGGPTLTGAPGPRWPIAAVLPYSDRPGGYGVCNSMEFKLRAIDTNGDFLPNAGTYTAEVLEGSPYSVPPDPTEKWAVQSRGSIAGNVGDVHRVDVGGSMEITVLITSAASIDADATNLVVDYHPVVEG